jgi:hypothetical protein
MARSFLVAALLWAAACAPAAGLPSRQADLAGLITNVGDGTGTILVEESRDPSTGAKASVTIDGSSRIWAVTGQSVTRVLPDVLRVGASVRVWFDGPVATSYPVRGRAADIAIGTVSGAPRLDILSKGGPAVVVRVNGADAARVACNGGEAIFAADRGAFLLPWKVQVVRESDGRILLDQRVSDLPRWMLVTRNTVGISDQAIAGPRVAC